MIKNYLLSETISKLLVSSIPDLLGDLRNVLPFCFIICQIYDGIKLDAFYKGLSVLKF